MLKKLFDESGILTGFNLAFMQALSFANDYPVEINQDEFVKKISEHINPAIEKLDGVISYQDIDDIINFSEDLFKITNENELKVFKEDILSTYSKSVDYDTLQRIIAYIDNIIDRKLDIYRINYSIKTTTNLTSELLLYIVISIMNSGKWTLR